MVTFTKDEIISSTTVSRSFSSILNKLKSRRLEKIGIIRNNEMEAILLPLREYGIMQELLEHDEYRKIYALIKEREDTPIERYVDLDEVSAALSGPDERV